MADLLLNPSALNTHHDYEGREYEVELSEVPRSRAPSYTSRNSAWTIDDNDENPLISRDRNPLFFGDSKGAGTTVRVESITSSRAKRKRLQGWRFGVLISAWTASTVLMLNLILTIWAATHFGSTLQDGVGTALEGNCEDVNHWATWLHIVINVLSSVLLSASNYTMQCICSPTRKEIDKAHAQGDWMDVGVASIRNIFKISWSRCALWWLLALSSIPIHLLYNSAIFKTLDANDYEIAVVNPSFYTQPANFSTQMYVPNYGGYSNYTMYNPQNVAYLQGLFGNDSAYANSGLVQNMSNSECISAYATSYVTGRSHLLAVTSAVGNITNETVFWETYVSLQYWSSNGWICMDHTGYSSAYGNSKCDPGSQRKNATEWTIAAYPIDYCLSWLAPARCKLQFSTQILITVILMNACKALVMFWTLYWQKEETLVTVGDALASWLASPDALTKDRCLMSKVDVDRGPLRWRVNGSIAMRPPSARILGLPKFISRPLGDNIQTYLPNTKVLPVTYHAPMHRRWFGAASRKRWGVTIALISAALITAISLFGAGYSNLVYNLDGMSPFALGFGAVDSRAVLNTDLPSGGAGGLVSAVLLANCPQAICSFLYLAYNGLLTCMHLCHEFSKFGITDRRKALRVTTPHGEQRSTYYLQLPYTYSIPLIIASATLHWLISQCIFLVRINEFTNLPPYIQSLSADPEISMSEVGYSCLPILLVTLLGTAMLAVAVGLGFRRFASHMPVAGSCSVALAAAAHRPKHDVDAAYLPVQWGEVNSEGNEEIGHCCFTSEKVHDLISGRMYAGAQYGSSADEGQDGHGLKRRRVDVDIDEP